MNIRIVSSATLALCIAAALPAHAGPQDMQSMPGMTMPMPTPAKKPVAKKPATKPVAKTVAKPAATAKPASRPSAKKPASAHAGMDMPGMDMGGMDMSGGMDHHKAKAPAKSASKKSETARRPKPHAMAGMHGMDMSMPGMFHARPGKHAGSTPGTSSAAKHDMSSMPGMDMSDMSGMHHEAAPERASKGARATSSEPATHDMPSMPGMGMSQPGHGDMAMPGMDMSTMRGMGASKDLPADAAPREPIAVPTDADRAAAFPALTMGHAAHDAHTHSLWRVDRLEVRDDDGGAWDATAWIGGDINRVWLRSEGDVSRGRVEHGSFETLYGHSISPWWDVVGGVRLDAGEGPERAYAAFGVQGMAPYKFELRATGYVGTAGHTAARLEGEYDTLLTNRLILQWRSEANAYGGSDPARRLGTGLSTVEAGARLRYEFTRRFAPYIGVEADHAFGGTAGYRRADGASINDTRIVAGVRLWF